MRQFMSKFDIELCHDAPARIFACVHVLATNCSTDRRIHAKVCMKISGDVDQACRPGHRSELHLHVLHLSFMDPYPDTLCSTAFYVLYSIRVQAECQRQNACQYLHLQFVFEIEVS